jgi:hypothetical protein
MKFLCEETHAACPHPGHQVDACVANMYLQLSVGQCPYLFRMLAAPAGLHTNRTGSDWICGAPQASAEDPSSRIAVCIACGGAFCLTRLPCVVL